MARGNSRANTEVTYSVPYNADKFREQNKHLRDDIADIGTYYDKEGRQREYPTMEGLSRKVADEMANEAKTKMDFELYQTVADNAIKDLTKDEKAKMNKVLDDTLARGLWFARSDQNQYDGYYPADYYTPSELMKSVKISICLKYLEEQGVPGAATVGPTFKEGDRSEEAKAQDDAWIKAVKMDVTELPKEYQMAVLTAERDISESFRTKNVNGVGSIASRLPDEKWVNRVPFSWSYVKPSRKETKTFYMSGYGKKILNRPDL